MILLGKARKSKNKGVMMMCYDKILSGENIHKWFHGVVVVTPDLESENQGLNQAELSVFAVGSL